MVSLLLTAAVAASTAAAPLDLDQAVAIALAHQPLLARARHLREAADARVAQDRAAGLPQASAGVLGQVGNAGGSFTLKAPDVAGAGLPNVSMGSRGSATGVLDGGAALGIGQTLWNPLLTARLAADRAQAAAERAGYALQAAATIRDVKLAFVEALRTRRRVAIARRIVHDRGLTLAQTRTLASAGLVAGLDVQQAEVRVRSAEADLILATNDADAAYSAFLLQLGTAPGASYTLADPGVQGEAAAATPPTPASTALPAPAPALALATAQASAAASQVEVARSAAGPRLSAFLNGGLVPAPLQPLYGAGLELSAPIFTSGLQEAREAEARASAAAAEAARLAAEHTLGQNLAVAREALVRDRQRFTVLDAQAALARRALELARERYRYRLASLLDVVTAETAVADAENRRNDAGYALGQDLAVLAYHEGSDLTRYHVQP